MASNINSGMAGYGGAIGSAIGSISSMMAINEQNKALEKQAEFNNKMLAAKDKVLKFGQANNINRANEAITSYVNDIAVTKFKFMTEANQQISSMANVIFSGIAAGATQERKIQTAYREVSEKIGEIDLRGDQAITQVMEQARSDNESLQIQKIENYNQTVLANAQLAGKAITGMNAALMIASAGVSGFQTGYGMGSNLDTLENQEKKLNTQNTDSILN